MKSDKRMNSIVTPLESKYTLWPIVILRSHPVSFLYFVFNNQYTISIKKYYKYY